MKEKYIIVKIRIHLINTSFFRIGLLLQQPSLIKIPIPLFSIILFYKIAGSDSLSSIIPIKKIV